MPQQRLPRRHKSKPLVGDLGLVVPLESVASDKRGIPSATVRKAGILDPPGTTGKRGVPL